MNGKREREIVAIINDRLLGSRMWSIEWQLIVPMTLTDLQGQCNVWVR